MKEQSSLLFRTWLKFIYLFRRPYLWARENWSGFFETKTDPGTSLDTSRMLTRFNWFHRIFFGRGFEKIRFNEEELKNVKEAYEKGPVIFLMRNWGQVEYNYFNYLFLQNKLPLVVHNNMIKMAHWMPRKVRKNVLYQKYDQFFREGHWPYNNDIFDLETVLKEKKPALLCLDLPRGNPWVDRNLRTQSLNLADLLDAQEGLKESIQLIPLHFIYDKHPGKAKKSLTDILFGGREHPGYFRKVILFLRNYKKRAVAKIGEPLELQSLIPKHDSIPTEQKPYTTLLSLQKVFDQESRQVTGPKLKSRKQMISEIMANPRFQERIEAVAGQEGVPLDTALKKANHHLRDIVSDINFTVLELWNYFLTWLFNRFYDGLVVDKAGIAKIKKVAKDSPLVLVPCHKSHVDYMLMSYVFYHHDLTLPHICAGRNLNFWPIGAVFRKSGAYFIRRSFSGDNLYALSLKTYVEELMREGYFQEFFIEGTRSRSGKLFPPKLGLLSMMVESFLAGELKDVFFVPTAIDYERVLEQSSYIKEIEGGKKNKEKFSDLLHLPKFLKKHYGKVYLQFGDPISLRERMVKEEVSPAQAMEQLEPFNRKLALEILGSISGVTTLFPSTLVATSLLTPLSQSITSKEIHQKCQELYEVARIYSPRLSESLQKNFHHGIQDTLDQFARDGYIQAHRGLDENFFTVPEAFRPILNFFKNKGINFFAEPALEKLCLRRHTANSGFSEKELLEATSELLACEFFIPTKGTDSPDGQKPEWISEIVLPLMESYHLAFNTLLNLQFNKMEEWLLVRKILERGRLLRLKGTLRFSESLSRFNIQNAIRQFVRLGVLKHHGVEMGQTGKKYFSPGPVSQPREDLAKLFAVLFPEDSP